MASYLKLWRDGTLAERAEQAVARLAGCDLCPRRCRTDRLRGRLGKCRTGRRAMVSSYAPHYGEERPLVGRSGSGTIFFTQCNLECLFCQNFEISHGGEGFEVSPEGLARMMLALQTRGCHNVNLVSPSHVVPQILEALVLAAEMGLQVPLVYNSGGYDSVDTLRLLDGVIDIYMPDAKYADSETGRALSGVKGYAEVSRAALTEMHRQVGDLRMDERGIAVSGLLVRHLVLPEGLAGTEDVARFIAEEVSAGTYLNVMQQYRPCFNARSHPQLRRPVTRDEYSQAVAAARSAGLSRLDRD
jgi:putative pyruvate formate lyase activating enzyme